MNINKSALDKAYRLAHDSGKVEPGRLVKAIALVPDVDPFRENGKSPLDAYYIPSLTTPGQDYWIVFYDRDKKVVQGCDCPDHKRNRGRLCKHMLAVMLIIRAGEIENDDLPPMEVISRAVSDPNYRERALSLLYPYND